MSRKQWGSGSICDITWLVIHLRWIPKKYNSILYELYLIFEKFKRKYEEKEKIEEKKYLKSIIFLYSNSNLF